MKSLTTSSQVFYISFLFICGTTLFSSCSKHAKKVKGSYNGTLSINDTIMSNNSDIIIAEVENNVISISSNYFTSYLIEIDKNRYFNSITYYSVEGNENLEIDGDGNMILIHMQDGEEFVFTGSRK